jgi:hypothetical protein
LRDRGHQPHVSPCPALGAEYARGVIAATQGTPEIDWPGHLYGARMAPRVEGVSAPLVDVKVRVAGDLGNADAAFDVLVAGHDSFAFLFDLCHFFCCVNFFVFYYNSKNKNIFFYSSMHPYQEEANRAFGVWMHIILNNLTFRDFERMNLPMEVRGLIMEIMENTDPDWIPCGCLNKP